MKWTLSALALAIFLAACGAGSHDALNPVAPNAPAVTAAAAPGGPATPSREVTGTLKGRLDFPLWGSEWWEIYGDTTAQGTVTHLGLSVLRARHIPDFDTATLREGEFTLVAANGDEITGTYEGTAAMDPERPDLGHASVTMTVTGGTGRFAGATGTLTGTLLEVFDDPTWASAGVTWTIEGTVRY
jgi:hypothetical protein